jgi:hypothetical protein
VADINYDDYADLLAQETPTGNADAHQMAQIDPLGSSLVGWGDASRNTAIRERISQISRMQGRISAAMRQRLLDAVDSNTSDWNRLADSILGPDGQKLHDKYQAFQGSDASALNDLKGEFGKYSNIEDLFSNPNFYGDVGDVENQAKPTDATVQQQRQNLAKYNTLSNTEETAQERFQRLMAQKTADANMKGARDTIAQDLKARGVYGSGAEVVMNMMSQADEANRRYMANLAADAQAQQRAMQALGAGSELASKMRGAETQEGALATQFDMFNNQSNQNLMNLRSGAQIQGRGTDNEARNKMATSAFQGATGNTRAARGDLNSEIGTRTGLTEGVTGARMGGANTLNTFDQGVIQQGKEKQAGLTADIDEPLLGGGIG